ncbi:MAG: riboflavin synthase [Acidobacteria bacterium]|nr:MAG: riboflavin synthase [Acidobacteriota bacterium]
MFTGIVEETGEVLRLERTARTARPDVRARVTLDSCGVGASVAVDGVCLTVVELRGDGFVFEVGPETLERTTLGALGVGDRVNLERPLRFQGTLGGHLVLGHVDGVGTVRRIRRVESTARVTIALPGPELAPLLIPQGSVAVDGVSLTVAALDDFAFEVMVIPHTMAVTTLGARGEGARVNIETDVIGKYVLRSMALRGT